MFTNAKIKCDYIQFVKRSEKVLKIGGIYDKMLTSADSSLQKQKLPTKLNKKCQLSFLSPTLQQNKVKMLQKSKVESTSILNSVSVDQLATLLLQATQASCIFEINTPKPETEQVFDQKNYRYRLEIRNRFLVQVDMKDGHIMSALELKFAYSFKEIEDLREDNGMLKQDEKKIRKFGLKIERIFQNQNSKQHEYSEYNSFFACQLMTSRYEQFKFFIRVLNKKSITHEIKTLNVLYKPGRLLKTNKFTKIYEVTQIKANKKLMVKAIPTDLIHLQGNSQFSMIDHPTGFWHPHLLKVQKVFKTQKTIYNVCQLYKYTLESYQKFFSKTIPNLKFIFSKIIEVLKFLHDQYFYHCNLKGEHVLIAVNGNQVVDIQVIGIVVETWGNSDMGDHEDKVQMDIKGVTGLIKSMIDDKEKYQGCKSDKTVNLMGKSEEEKQINERLKKLLQFIVENSQKIRQVEMILNHQFFNDQFHNPQNEMELQKLSHF